MTRPESPILVIGREGQLARALAAVGHNNVLCIGRPEADLADAQKLAALMARYTPRLVLNAGGFTKVDPAETQPSHAFALNRDGPATLAGLCEGQGIPLIHISTDCVFGGESPEPYSPDDEPRPLSVYGRSKLAGEDAVAAHCSRHLIVRVSWVFSEHADNFVPMMLRLARARQDVTVVDDQVGYPTYCPDLAEGLLLMAETALRPGFAAWGTYHLAGRQETNRAAMAQAIFAESRALGGPAARVNPVATADYGAPAARPLNARLNSAKAEAVFGIVLPDWYPSLQKSVRVLLSETN